MLLIVVPQNGELPQPSLEPPQNGLDPLDHIVVLDDIARDHEQVGGPAAAEVDDPLEEIGARSSGAKWKSLSWTICSPSSDAGQAGHRHLPLAQAEPERIVAGQSQQPRMAAAADQGVAAASQVPGRSSGDVR